MLWLKRIALALWMALAVAPALAQGKEQGTLISEVDMYVSPDASSQKLARATRGRNVVLVMERSKMGGRDWAHRCGGRVGETDTWSGPGRRRLYDHCQQGQAS